MRQTNSHWLLEQELRSKGSVSEKTEGCTIIHKLPKKQPGEQQKYLSSTLSVFHPGHLWLLYEGREDGFMIVVCRKLKTIAFVCFVFEMFH